MSNPLFVSIPHHLGRDEAVRRLKTGLNGARSQFAHLLNVQEETWTDNHLQFRVSVFGQSITGTIDVLDDSANLQIVLPWLLAKLAEKIQPLIRKEGVTLLEKK